MQPNYTYTPSNEFAHSLTFEYMETYSFQRGEDYRIQLRSLQDEFGILSAKKKSIGQLNFTEESRWNELNNLVGFTQYIFNEQGRLHPSARKIVQFESNDSWVTRFLSILETEIKDVPMFMCAPTYRDAAVFHNRQQEIVAVLNICFSCQYMETQPFKHINADRYAYELLKLFFADIGHEVESR